MTEIGLEPIGLQDGIWRARISGKGAELDRFAVTYLGDPVADVAIVPDIRKGMSQLAVPVPMSAISEGVHTFLVHDTRSGKRLASFTLMAGDLLDADVRAEIDVLRSELEVLKRALRRHVTGQGGT